MKNDKTLYTEESIKHLAPREFIRAKSGIYLGDNSYNSQLIKEIFANSFDEHTIGHGDVINISVDTKKNKYVVEDNGQGFPINVIKGKDKKTILQQAFDTLNTSGKFTDDGVYSGSSLGNFGIGTKLTNFLSTKLEVISYNSKGEFEHLTFKDGIFESREVGKDPKHQSGTRVEWYPDKQFFQKNEPEVAQLKDYFEEVAALSGKVTINFKYNDREFSFSEPGGITKLLENRVGDKKLLNDTFSMRKEVDGELFDIALTFTTDYSANISAYINYGATESGVHITAFKQAFAKALNNYAKDKGLVKEKEGTLSFEELSEGLAVIFNLKAKGVKYDAQVKTRVVDIDRKLLTQVMSGDFAAWLINNGKDAETIVERAANARRARKAAQDAREKIRNADSGKVKKKFIDLPSKLVDAWSKDRSKCEIYITEGDSAANGLIARRDGETQAIFPIRGKILSCRKATRAKIYGNQEIANIVKALGLSIEEKTGKLIYDQKKLRYDKIIFATDADDDGMDIRLLLLTMFWELCPELIYNKHIYVAIPPLYRVTTKQNKYIFLTGDKDLEEYRKKHKNESFLVNRNKGLGEQDPDEVAECLLHPDTRNIQPIIGSEDRFDEIDKMLEMAKGPGVEDRRAYLLDYYDKLNKGEIEEARF